MAARLRLKDAPNGDVWEATRFALRSVARRYEVLSEEIAQLDTHTSMGWLGKAPRSWFFPARHRHRPRRDAAERSRRQSRGIG